MAIFIENRHRVEWLTTRQVSDLFRFARPNRALSNYEVGSLLGKMKELERVSPKNECPARWSLKEEEVI